MNLKTIFFLLLSLSLLSNPANSGTATGVVTGYIPYSSGSEALFFIKVTNHTNGPACNVTGRFTMTSANAKYQSTNVAIIAALAAGTNIIAKGYDTCNNWSNAEDLNYICFGDIPC